MVPDVACNIFARVAMAMCFQNLSSVCGFVYTHAGGLV